MTVCSTFQYVTPVRGYHRLIRRSCSRSFSRPTIRLPIRRAARALDWQSRSELSRCMAGKFGLIHVLDKARHSLSRFQLELSSRRNRCDKLRNTKVELVQTLRLAFPEAAKFHSLVV